MQYVQEIILDVNSNVAYSTIGAKQGDGDSRTIKAYLTENGSPYTIDDNATAYFRFRKPDGNAIINTATILEDRHCVQITLTAQVLAAAGRGYADIVIQRGTEILSTVSFIIIIMASPSVANQAVSGNEFGYLNSVVADSLNTTYEAEAWAAGTRGGVAVASASYFNVTHGTAIPSHEDVITDVAVTQSDFYNIVGNQSGISREYTFTYKNNELWGLVGVFHNGPTTSTDSEKIITNNDLVAYGINITCPAGNPNEGNFVKVSLAEEDSAYQNNAKYYATQANDAAAQASEVLSTSIRYTQQDLTTAQQEVARVNIGANNFITKPSNSVEGQLLQYSDNGWVASSASALDLQGIPSILTSDFYGEALPTTGVVEGRIFFVKS